MKQLGHFEKHTIELDGDEGQFQGELRNEWPNGLGRYVKLDGAC
jgi:hypothetical protein